LEFTQKDFSYIRCLTYLPNKTIKKQKNTLHTKTNSSITRHRRPLVPVACRRDDAGALWDSRKLSPLHWRLQLNTKKHCQINLPCLSI